MDRDQSREVGSILEEDSKERCALRLMKIGKNHLTSDIISFLKKVQRKGQGVNTNTFTNECNERKSFS